MSPSLFRLLLARAYPSFSTLAKSSSTGVERPKIVTETFNRLWSLSISSTLPLKFANGPSTMRTCSLRSKRSEEHTSELQSHSDLVCRLLLEKKKKTKSDNHKIE